MTTDIHFERIEPPPDLVGVVRFFYRVRSATGSSAQVNHPQGTVDLLFVLSGGVSFDKGPTSKTSTTSAGAVLVPLQTHFFRFAFAPGTHILGAAFEPLSWRDLVDVEPGSFTDTAVDFEAAGDSRMHRLKDLLANAKPPSDLDLLVNFCRRPLRTLARSSRLRTILPELPKMVASGAGVDHLANSLAVSPRTLQRAFRSELGLSPKEALRLARFELVLDGLRRPLPPRWSDLAQASGFYDQAHLSNELRRITGFSPSAFLRRVSPLAIAFDRARGLGSFMKCGP